MNISAFILSWSDIAGDIAGEVTQSADAKMSINLSIAKHRHSQSPLCSCGRCAPPLQRSASFCLVVLRRCCSSALATFAACESPRVSGRRARTVPSSCSTTRGREADSAPSSFLLANKSCFWHAERGAKACRTKIAGSVPRYYHPFLNLLIAPPERSKHIGPNLLTAVGGGGLSLGR